MNPLKKPNNYIKEKIHRFKPIVFLRKNIIIISIILVIVLSFLLGFWNIKHYEIYSTDTNDTNQTTKEQVETYIKENVINNNFFTLNTNDLKSNLIKQIPYLKTVKIDKVAPNKLILFTTYYKAKLIANLGTNGCYILSEDGILLEQICTNSEDTQCCDNYPREKLYILKSNDLTISQLENSKQQLLATTEINKIVKVIETFKYAIDTITVENNLITVKDTEGRTTILSMSDDIELQLQRYYVIISKVKTDEISYTSIDVRFERPVMKI